MNNEELWNDKYLLKNEELENRHLDDMRKELLKSENRRRKNELLAVKNQNKIKSERLKKLTTTKILTYFILINCSVVEIYSMYVMYSLQDLSALYSLIGAVIGESITFAIYCAKSFKDTNSEEQLKFEREKFNSNFLTEEEKELAENVIPDEIPTDDDHSGDIPTDEEPLDETMVNID